MPGTMEEALARFGLAGFRPGQREVIEAVLAGRPTIGVLPTGAGKSLCYQLPAVALGGLTVVVSPLISLMKDQVDALAARGVPAAFINSSVDPEAREARLRAALSGALRLLYVAPERFRVPGFVERLRQAELALFAVDEAHCIAEWGHDFRPDYARIGEVIRQLRPPRVVALTATATPDVRGEIAAQLGLRDPVVIVRGFDRPNLRFEVVQAGGDADKLQRCLALLEEPGARGAVALVYAATRKKAERVAEALSARGVRAAAYHAGLEAEARARVQEEWMAGRVRVVVATNAFGMGVDKREVRLVVHHDLPGSPEAYWQEAGRAGRDGQPARCVLLFNHADVRLREFLITAAGEGGPRPPERIAAERDRLRAMMGYCYARRCRRAYLLGWFGDPEAGQGCGGCDVCDGRTAVRHAVISDEDQLLVRKVLATVARVHGRFGRNRVALALEGSTAKEVTSAGLEKLSTYGVLRGRSHTWVLDLLGALEAAGLIEASTAEYPTLGLTALGREVMHDRVRAPVELPRDRAKDKRVRAAAPLPDAPGGLDAELLERLRGVRTRLAREAGLPSFYIFHDRTLQALARTRPTTREALLAVPGVGPQKLEKYGEAFLAVLAGA